MLIAGIFIAFMLTIPVAFLQKMRGLRTAYIWLTLTLVAFLAWLVMLVIPHNRINPFEISRWYQIADIQVGLRFHIDPSNWALVFALLTLHLAFLLTSLARLDVRHDLQFWLMEMVQAALSYAVLTAADLRTILLAWTALDVAGLSYWLFFRSSTERTEFFKPYILKLIGSLLVIFTIAKLSGAGQSLNLEDLPSSVSFTLFLAAILHSGVIPVLKPARSGRFMVNILNFSTNFFSFLTSFYLMISLPLAEIPLLLDLILILFSLVIVCHFGRQWMRATDEISGAYDLLAACGGMFAAIFLSNYRLQLAYWLIALMICLTWLLLYTHRSRTIILFPILVLFSISGLPFSLTSAGSRGLLSEGISFATILLMIPIVMIITGFIRHSFAKRQGLGKLEPWFQAVYLTGLFIPILSYSAIILYSVVSLNSELSYWWMGLLISGAAVGLYFWLVRQGGKTKEEAGEYQNKLKYLDRFLSLKWIFTLTKFFGIRIKSLVTGISQLLEGEGGVLWAIVFMALLITMLRTG